MKTKLCDIAADIGQRLPEFTDDKSGVAVHYVDAFLKPMNTKLEDGTAVRAKRRGLKVVFSAGTRKGEGLLRRLQHGPNPVAMLNAALQEAARMADVEITIEENQIFLNLSPAA